MNLNVETVEELLVRRKNLHLGMLKLAREDLIFTLQTALDESQVRWSTLKRARSRRAGRSASNRGAAPRPSPTPFYYNYPRV
jgi:hypothetical protein